MGFQTVFKRYELKYMLTKDQKEELIQELERYMEPDPYGDSTVRSLYFDTDTYRLIRRSLEKPVYKEKLRIRSYSKVSPQDTVFIELKKKFESIVYKRRLAISEQDAMDWMATGVCPVKGQIADEISYFWQYYKTLRPAALISYDRQAFFSKVDENFRISFDQNIQSRRQELSLTKEPGGEQLIGSDQALMEVKTAGGLPIWLVSYLTENRIFKTSFSKYGTAYQRQIYTGTAPVGAYDKVSNGLFERKEGMAYA